MKNWAGRLQIFIVKVHPSEGVIIKDVDATPSIHEDLCEGITTNFRRHHQS